MLAMSKSEEAAWRTLRANDYKSATGLCGILNGVVALALAIFVYLFAVPAVPPSLTDYGWIFHALHIALWAPAVAASGAQSRELLSLLALMFCLPTLLLDTWALGVNFVPWLVGCISGHPNSFFYDCAAAAPYMITLTALALLFFISTAVIFYNVLALLSYINGAVVASAPAARSTKTE